MRSAECPPVFHARVLYSVVVRRASHLHGVVGRRRKRDDRSVVVLVGHVDGHVRRRRHGRVA